MIVQISNFIYREKFIHLFVHKIITRENRTALRILLFPIKPNKEIISPNKEIISPINS